jgi:hypothetical protein
VLDLKGAYQQLKLSENSKELVTINTHKGLYQYQRLPFGVSSAPAIFQSVMDQILSNLENVSCYLDDIMIGGQDEKSCKSKLFEVLRKLNDYNVKVNLDKCQFFNKSIKYLGHTISSNGIQPNEDKVKALVESPPPRNKLELQSFLGLMNYYGKFIKNLSSNF